MDAQPRSRPDKIDSMPHLATGGQVFRRLLGLLRPQAKWIALGLALLLLSMPAELFPAFVWMYVTDALIIGKPSGASIALGHFFSFGDRLTGWPALLASSLAWMVAIYLVYELLSTLSRNVMERVAQKFILDLRNRVYRKLQGQSLAYLQRQRTGDLMSRAISDVDELQSFTVNGIDVIIGEGVLWIVTVVVVMLIDWRVATASLAPVIGVYVLLKIFNRRVAPIYRAARDRAGDVSTRLQENLSGVPVIRIFGREATEARRFRDATERYYAQQLKAINARSLYFPFSRAAGFMTNVCMLGVGGYLILTNAGFTVGKLLMFRAYWWRLFGPIQTLARVNDMVQRAIAAGRRVFEVLDAPDEMPDAPDAIHVQHISGAMELRGVSFSYSRAGAAAPPGELIEQGLASHVLHDISLRIEPGQTVALCGPSGGGKTTILNLLLRFYDPTTGAVMLDGIDLRRIQRDSLRHHFALVQQESFLFNETILDNIRYGHPEATMEQVIDAAHAANAHGFITRLPSGYETVVGERGVRLSGGQRQRISIARAFLTNPRILLLDEPTSSVEPESESAIIAALDRLMTGRTTVLTSHRPSLIGQADVVYLIHDGRVTDRGAPAELRQRDRWFERFMRSAEMPSESTDEAGIVE
jgi:ABC-type multidrug transport system fused ATPase/permease subunit